MNHPVIQIESKTAQINDAIEYDLSERLQDTFGVVVSGVDIGAIEIDKFSEGYRQLMSVTNNYSQHLNYLKILIPGNPIFPELLQKERPDK